MTKLAGGFLALLVAAPLAGCGLGKDPRHSSQLDQQERVRAFGELMHPVVRDADCAGCHSGSGPPAFAAAPTSETYAVARAYVDFASPAASRLVAQAVRAHGGCASCGPGSAMESRLVAAIDAWGQAEHQLDELAQQNGGEPPPAPAPTSVPESPYVTLALRTAPVPLPSNLPVYPAAGSTLTFDLRGLLEGGPPAGTATLRMTAVAQRVGTNGLLFSSFRLANLTPTAVRVEGVYVALDAALFERATNQLRDTVVTVDAGRTVAISTRTVLITYAGAVGTHSVSLGFERLARAASLPPCRALAAYSSPVVATLTAKCASCHSVGGSTATATLDLRGTDAESCARVLQWVSADSPFQSPVLQAIQNGVLRGTTRVMNAVPLTAAERAGLESWISQETSASPTQ